MSIYLDYSATTPTDKEVLNKMLPYFDQQFGNPSSIHGFGREANKGLLEARENVAQFLNCDPGEIVFSSGATEANNLAIRGIWEAVALKSKEKLHFITSAIEHSSVMSVFAYLEKQGVEVTYLPVDKKGLVNPEILQKSLQKNTVLVSINYVNTEVGVLEPIRELAKVVKKTNERNLKEWQNTRPALRKDKPRPIYFHTDAVQAANFFKLDTQWDYIDLLTISGHKIYGPKGVGVLFIRKGIPMAVQQHGGYQEGARRSGTQNVPGIVGLGEAIRLLSVENQTENNEKIVKLRDKLVSEIQSKISNTVLNTDINNSAPSFANITFLGIEGESILISLDLEGIAVSTGSACASAGLKASHVLMAMGVKKEQAHGSIRFTIGRHTSETEIKKVVEVLVPIIERLRKMAPDLKMY